MGKLLVPFDPVMMRWLNESSGDSTYNSEQSKVFETGYDDPSYLTFRIEFGGWGATTIPSLDTFKLMQRINTLTSTGLVNTTPTNYRYEDYPLGLLDLNFAETSIKTYPGYAFNSQVSYNAYNYLLQRNEDTRAEYLKEFVEGLYEIQRKHPYIFKSISGINTLTQIKPTNGFRIRDAVINIECIEGLLQKMKTLMNLYKKAAWDHMYQRWILPENYRLFKMIIYVFERRQFHSITDMGKASTLTSTTPNAAGQPNESTAGGFLSDILNTPIGPVPEGFLPPITIKQPTLGLSSVNPLLPVTAFECDLCEFDISDGHEQDSFDVAWEESEPVSTTLNIKVGTVRHYYKNGLLKRLKSNLIYDLVSVMERKNSSGMKDSDQGVASYIDRSRILENEAGVAARLGFGGGGGQVTQLDMNTLKTEWNNMCNNWQALFGKKVETETNPLPALTTAQTLMEEGRLIYDVDSYWLRSTITGSKFKYTGKFWHDLLFAINSAGEQWVLDLTAARNSTYVNMQSWCWPEYDDKWLTYYSYAIQSMWDGQENSKRSNLANNIIQTGEYDTKDTIGRQSSLGSHKDELLQERNPALNEREKTGESRATNKEYIHTEDELQTTDREIPDDMVENENGRYEFESEATDNAYDINNDLLPARELMDEIFTELEDPRNLYDKIGEPDEMVDIVSDIPLTDLEDSRQLDTIVDDVLIPARDLETMVDDILEPARDTILYPLEELDEPKQNAEFGLFEIEDVTRNDIEQMEEVDPSEREIPSMIFEDAISEDRQLPEFANEDFMHENTDRILGDIIDESENTNRNDIEIADESTYDIERQLADLINEESGYIDEERILPEIGDENSLIDLEGLSPSMSTMDEDYINSIAKTMDDLTNEPYRTIDDTRMEHGLVGSEREIHVMPLDTVSPDVRKITDMQLEHGLSEDGRTISDMSMYRGSSELREIHPMDMEAGSMELRELPDMQLEHGSNELREIHPMDMEAGSNELREIPDIQLEYGSSELREIHPMDMEAGLSELRSIPDMSMETVSPEVRQIPSMDMDVLDLDDDIHTGIIFETMDDPRQLEIIHLNNEMEEPRNLPKNVIIDREEFLSVISTATSITPDKSFIENDKILQESERKLADLLLDDDTTEAKEMVARMSATDNRDLLKVINEFSSNSDDIRSEAESRIKTMQQQLIKASEEAIREIPPLAIVAAEKNPLDLNKDFIMVPIEVVDRIKENYMLSGIDDDVIKKLSLTNLVQLEQYMGKAWTDTEALVSVIQTDVKSTATSNKNMKMVNIIKTENKSTKGKTLLR